MLIMSDDRRHCSSETFLLLENGGLTAEERSRILQHLEECVDCMDAYMDSLSEEVLLEPPEGMEQRILQAVSREKRKKKESKVLAIQFVKLAVAVCLTLVMMAGGVFDFASREPRNAVENNAPLSAAEQVQAQQPKQGLISAVMRGFSDGFNQWAYGFTYGFSNKGDGNHAAK